MVTIQLTGGGRLAVDLDCQVAPGSANRKLAGNLLVLVVTEQLGTDILDDRDRFLKKITIIALDCTPNRSTVTYVLRIGVPIACRGRQTVD